MSSALKGIKSAWEAIQAGLRWAGEKIAIVVTPIFLSVFYFTVIAVAGIVTKITRADLLHRNPVGNPTFWFVKPKEPMDESRYRAQF